MLFRSLVDHCFVDVSVLAASKEIELVKSVDSSAVVFGDETQLATALRNLLLNAITYSPSGTRVSVASGIVGEVIEISVKDEGIGIAPSDRERIFERFYRVDPARSRESGGNGLGLAIVKHVCLNHGGECSVWSSVDTGSTFTLRLPRVEYSKERQVTFEESSA